MKKRIYFILIIFIFASCSDYKLIPEKELKAIVTEALISDAIMERERMKVAEELGVKADSMDIYAPILDRYGYSLADFRYTVNSLSMRKSNPLDNIFENIAKEIEIFDAIAKERYEKLLKFDTLALNFYADTIYRKNDTIHGSLSKFKIIRIPAREGKYKVWIDYSSLMDQRLSTKYMTYEATSKKLFKSNGTFWMNRNAEVQKLRNEFTLASNYDSLKLSFFDPKIDKVLEIVDTSFVTNFRVIYYPPISKVRSDYYYLKTGFIPYTNNYYEKRFLPQADSVIIPFEPRQAKKKRGGSVRLLGTDIKR